jgi:rhamnogalacturonyl hydrolase YesR
MRNKHLLPTLASALFLLVLIGCGSQEKKATKDIIADNVENAVAQYTLMTDIIEASGKILNPRTVLEDGSIWYVPIDDWCSGFFPGSMWYLHELTGDEKWKNLAIKYTEDLDSVKHLKWHHDVGFMIGSSYLNGLRIANKEEYKDVIVTAAQSLATRYRPTAKVIQSWDIKGWQAERGWECPVIIDNMMNLELMFEAFKFSGDSTLYNIAVDHANTTLANHFRENNSCYHVIDYSLADGSVRNKNTAQGYAHESSWSRGQAWAIYGFTMCYRYTGDKRYLDHAENVYKFIFNHERLPEDLIPYWDYDAPNIPNEPRDASAAAATACALLEMSTYVPNSPYKETADKILEALSSPAYRAEVGTNGNFILMHSVGSIPHGHEIDVPINYADYYFLEALIKKKRLEKGEPIL